jgi:hypothetical protein
LFAQERKPSHAERRAPAAARNIGAHASRLGATIGPPTDRPVSWGNPMNRVPAVAGVALAICLVALAVLNMADPWTGPMPALVATTASLAIMGVAAGLAITRGWTGAGARVTRIATGLALGWFLVFGLMLAGAGFDTYMWDGGHSPDLPVAVDESQPTQVAVGAVCVLAGGVGMLAIALGSRAHRREA